MVKKIWSQTWRIIQELNLKPEFANKSPLMVTLDVRFHFGKSQIP